MLNTRSIQLYLLMTVWINGGLFTPNNASGQPCFDNEYSIYKLADTNLMIPNDTNYFSAFWQGAPVLSESHIVTHGYAQGVHSGVYIKKDNEFTNLADRTTAVLGFSSPLISAYDPTTFGDTIYLEGQAEFPERGILKWENDTLSLLIDSNCPVINSTNDIMLFSHPWGNETNVAFVGGGENGNGIYLYSTNGITEIAVQGKPIPNDTNTFLNFNDLILNMDTLAFTHIRSNWHFRNELFTLRSNVLQSTINTNIPMPGFTGTISEVASPILYDNQIVFKGDHFNNVVVATNDMGDIIGLSAFHAWSGIYKWDAGTVTTLVDRNDGPPETNLLFNAFSQEISYDRDRLLFVGISQGIHIGLYLKCGTNLIKVLARGDLLDGKVLHDFRVSRQSLNNHRISFQAQFADLSFAQYFGEILNISEIFRTETNIQLQIHGIHSNKIHLVQKTTNIMSQVWTNTGSILGGSNQRSWIIPESSYSNQTHSFYRVIRER